MYFCPLFSGSNGNALFVQYGATRVLIDAGRSGVFEESFGDRRIKTAADKGHGSDLPLPRLFEKLYDRIRQR